MAETMWSIFVTPSPLLVPPLQLGKKNTDKPNTVSYNEEQKDKKGLERQINHHQKQQLISSRSCYCWQEQIEATTKQTNKHFFVLTSSRVGHWTGFGFWKLFQEDKKIIAEKSLIVRQQRNKKKGNDWLESSLFELWKTDTRLQTLCCWFTLEKSICRSNCWGACCSAHTFCV